MFALNIAVMGATRTVVGAVDCSHTGRQEATPGARPIDQHAILSQ
jgi:hypothetical protein